MARGKSKPKIYTAQKENKFNIIIGTTMGQEKPKVVYVRSKIRISPIIEKDTYADEILNIKNEFNKLLKKTLSTQKLYQSNSLFDLSVAENSVDYKKTSHLRYEIYFQTCGEKEFQEHKENLLEMTDVLEKDLIKKFQEFHLKYW